MGPSARRLSLSSRLLEHHARGFVLPFGGGVAWTTRAGYFHSQTFPCVLPLSSCSNSRTPMTSFSFANFFDAVL